MTGQEAIAGFQELSRHFRKGYKWGELEPVWEDLLKCSHQAMVRAVGIMIKNGKRLPDPGYVLARVQWWDMNLQPQVEHDHVKRVCGGRDPDAEAREVFDIMRVQMEPGFDRQSLATRLFSMSERYGKPSYALQAHELLQSKG